MNIDAQNKGPRLKNLHKFYNRYDIPWVHLVWNEYYSDKMLPGVRFQGSFWWRQHLKLVDAYKGMAKCNVGNESSVFFWHDLWQRRCFNQQFPHLYSISKDVDMSVSNAIQKEFLEDIFFLPLSREAHQEFLKLEELWEDTP